MNHKKIIIIGIIGLILIPLLFIKSSKESLLGGSELWKFGSSAIFPIVSTWDLASSTTRIAKGWFTDLDSTSGTIGTLVISSSATGPLIVNGNIRASVGTAASPSFTFRTDQDTGMFMPASNSLSFSTLGSERIRVISDGNVGIGTTTPGTKLEVKGGIIRASDASTTGAMTMAIDDPYGYYVSGLFSITEELGIRKISHLKSIPEIYKSA